MTAQAQAAQPSLRTTVRNPRRVSRSALLWTLYRHAPLTRQELVRHTELSATTVNAVIGELIAEGVVTEVESDPGAGVRRTRARLRLVPEHRYVIGVDIADTRVRVGLFDLARTQRAGVSYPLPSDGYDARIVVGHILTGLDAVVEAAGIPQGHIAGIGIGMSVTGWDAVPLEGLLRTGTALPLHIDSAAEAMGRAEMWFGAGRGVQHAVVALIGSGVGASVITHGASYRGATNSAGQWGHTTVQAGGRSCRCGARGCLEAYVGADAVLERFRQARRGRIAPGADKESAFAALLAAADTSTAAQRVLEEAAVYLGAGIANLVNLFNPQRIILGGWAGLLFGARMLPRIRETVAAQALRRPYAHTDIGLCGLGPHAVALGAAALPVRHFLTEGAQRAARRPATTPRGARTRAAPTTRMPVP
ncbi:ROK family transcriptional regulator [Streptomyces malaysiensis]|uniref:ROK family transcriptional regulator n=1 Tax=Streptomyces malaysiensis TaxID=92644 RepID=UPI000BFD3FBA|nr:ROK family transcriptional regulator [Streptomyces malaysiensis]ATL86896.1 transcriptional repressor of the xylose operon [Streptomyces malaysiensis]QDL69598.1 ROK family transcriptional regulator [Streptomyces malaysiensis]